jgi:hypothetical protein
MIYLTHSNTQIDIMIFQMHQQLLSCVSLTPNLHHTVSAVESSHHCRSHWNPIGAARASGPIRTERSDSNLEIRSLATFKDTPDFVTIYFVR